MAKMIWAILLSLALNACSQAEVEEFAFRKSLEYQLVELCGEDSPDCIEAVKAQVNDCMVKSDWRRYMDNQDNQAELKRFTHEFYACVVDDAGKPFFESTL